MSAENGPESLKKGSICDSADQELSAKRRSKSLKHGIDGPVHVHDRGRGAQQELILRLCDVLLPEKDDDDFVSVRPMSYVGFARGDHLQKSGRFGGLELSVFALGEELQI
jgi:hypothetical protein